MGTIIGSHFFYSFICLFKFLFVHLCKIYSCNYKNMINAIPFMLFGNTILFIVAIVLLVIIAIIADIVENGYIVTTAVITFLVINHLWGTFPILSIFTKANFIFLGLYLLCGFVFSLVRTYAKGKELKAKDKESDANFPNRKSKLHENFELKEHVFRWWFLFPVALINWVFGRLMVDMFNMLYEKIGKLYVKIFNA